MWATLSVKPNELVRERPFIAYNIDTVEGEEASAYFGRNDNAVACG
jgi:uncharacterized membrane protein (UPF0182 family)